MGQKQTIYNIQFRMLERKLWKKQEDDVLKELFQVRKISKWSQIARIMASEFCLLGRNGKQCRQRYNNHLDSKIKKEKWSEQEQKVLFQMHEKIGNRWSTISSSLEGRTDSAIKNYFYATLRKGIHKMNQLIPIHFHKQFKILKPAVLNKIIEASQQRFIQSDDKTQQTALTCLELKRGIYQFSKISEQLQQQKIEKLRELVSRANRFAKVYRKKKHSQRAKQQQCSEVQMCQEDQYDKIDNNQMQLAHQITKSIVTRSTVSAGNKSNKSISPNISNIFDGNQNSEKQFYIFGSFDANFYRENKKANDAQELQSDNQKMCSQKQAKLTKSGPTLKLSARINTKIQKMSSILIEQSQQIQEQPLLHQNQDYKNYQNQKQKQEVNLFDSIVKEDRFFDQF